MHQLGGVISDECGEMNVISDECGEMNVISEECNVNALHSLVNEQE